MARSTSSEEEVEVCSRFFFGIPPCGTEAEIGTEGNGAAVVGGGTEAAYDGPWTSSSPPSLPRRRRLVGGPPVAVVVVVGGTTGGGLVRRVLFRGGASLATSSFRAFGFSTCGAVGLEGGSGAERRGVDL